MSRLLRFFPLFACLWLLPLTLMAQPELLPVTEAFKLEASVPEPGRIELAWDIADDYYMYRERIKVRALEADVDLGEMVLPEGEAIHDEYFGDVEIYHHAVTASVPYVTPADADDRLVLEVEYQGCHEVDPKICYPPQRQTLKLDAPPAPAGTAAIDAGPTNTSQATGVPLGMPLNPAHEPLPPDEAFRFSVIDTGERSFTLRWDMPDGYYLYRDQTQLTIADDGVAIAQAEWPQGDVLVDEFFGESEVYFGRVDVPVTLERSTDDAQTVTLHAIYQGCQEHGICYPPITREVTVDLPAWSAPAVTADVATSSASDSIAADPEAQSEVEKIAGVLAGNGRWLALLGFLLAGLALAFTPCVLPMVPILSGLIAGAGKNLSTARAFVLSLVYVLASSLVFVVAGVVAGVAGASLQAAFQAPWLLSAFALIFVLLALSMFGFYELKLPAVLQNRLTALSNKQRGGSLPGVAIMGVLSALIVGPCVAPPLAGAVLYIAQTRDPVFGALALFMLSIGMGLPLIVFGTAAGRILPHAGGWMLSVQRVFGVLFLALAIYMLSRFMNPVWIMLATGVLCMVSAVYMGAFESMRTASGWRKLWKALGLVLFLLGAMELVGVGAGSRNLLAPLAGLGGSSASDQDLRFKSIKTVDDLTAAVAAAQAQGKPVMLDFYADWCITCKQMEQFTYTDANVMAHMRDFVLLQADVTQNDKDDQALLKHFQLFGPPAYIFYPSNSQGREHKGQRLVGFENIGKFRQRLAQVQAIGGNAN